jgi:hypothetical protein
MIPARAFPLVAIKSKEKMISSLFLLVQFILSEGKIALKNSRKIIKKSEDDKK